MSKRKTPKPTVAEGQRPTATVSSPVPSETPGPDAGLPEFKKGDVPLILEEVLALVRHKKSWLYAKIRALEFPSGYMLFGRRIWIEREVLD